MKTETAYAKINLALHVRRRRDDGYHDIETVFAFCEDGDVVSVQRASEANFSIGGPFSTDLPLSANNIVAKAVEDFCRTFEVDGSQSVSLYKNLPVAAGIGGGSADAAAALRALAHMYGKKELPAIELCAASLGADVPACLASRTARGDGIGHHLTEAVPVTGTPVLLINPRIALSTAAVFAEWDGKDRGPLADWRDGRNDLEAPARSLVPQIGGLIDWLAGRRGVTCARMSGSGATCFALFDTVEARKEAERETRLAFPAYWIMESVLR
jgi:4-diphosphocytidyl-2-C-methyl-D-erythritol kinase